MYIIVTGGGQMVSGYGFAKGKFTNITVNSDKGYFFPKEDLTLLNQGLGQRNPFFSFYQVADAMNEDFPGMGFMATTVDQLEETLERLSV